MNIEHSIFIVVDVETTGLNPETDRCVEVAAVAMSPGYGILGMWATLVNPAMPIPAEVSAIHYLTDSDVAHAPDWVSAYGAFTAFRSLITNGDESVLVAHNAAFDSGFVVPAFSKSEDCEQWLCTQRIAKQLWPDAPTFKNQGLRFWRGLIVDTFGVLPHRALGDALVTAALLRDELTCPEFRATDITKTDRLLEFSSAPIRMTCWPKGKYYGKRLDVDEGYARWYLGNVKDIDPDLKFSLQELLQPQQLLKGFSDS